MPLRLIMMGTGPFAVPTLGKLYDSRHEVVLLVTRPVHPPSGNRPPPPAPMRELAVGRGTPVFDPEDVNSEAARSRLAECRADLLVVCDYGQILSTATLGTARLGGINLHASLLPKYRGAAPINWAIWRGEQETGVTVIHMTPQLDAGPAIAQRRVAIEPDETAAQLEPRLAEVGGNLVAEMVDALERGPLEALPQDPALASKARRLRKTDAALDWTQPAAVVRNQIRALEPWPRNYTFWRRPSGPPLRLILGPVSMADPPAATGDEAGSAAPAGTVLAAAGDRLIVAAGQGAIQLSLVQPSGKRPLSIAEFLRGYPVRPGELFGDES